MLLLFHFFHDPLTLNKVVPTSMSQWLFTEAQQLSGGYPAEESDSLQQPLAANRSSGRDGVS